MIPMLNKNIIIGLIVILGLAGGLLYFSKKTDTNVEYVAPDVKVSNYPDPVPVVPSAGVSVKPLTDAAATSSVKEFTMTSWMEKVGDTMSAHFSLAEMTVKKGDTVRVKITNTKGTHDFMIDEFKVALDTPEGKEVVVEFVADKVGDFEFYCSKYNHRALGQKGTLHVTE